MESARNVMLLRVDREYLTSPSFGQLSSDLFDEFSFLGIELHIWKITRIGDHKTNIALEFGIKLCSVQSSQAIRMVRVEQQCIQHRAQHRPVASVLFQSFPDAVFQFP